MPDTDTVGAVNVLPVNVLTVSGVLALNALNLLSNVVCKSTPAKYSGPASIMLDPIMAEPATSIDGALTGAENTAAPAARPSRSTPFESARLNVPDAGFTRAQVSSDSCSELEEVSVACFPASAAVSPVTSAMPTGPEDDCAEPSACKMFVDPTIS